MLKTILVGLTVIALAIKAGLSVLGWQFWAFLVCWVLIYFILDFIDAERLP